MATSCEGIWKDTKVLSIILIVAIALGYTEIADAKEIGVLGEKRNLPEKNSSPLKIGGWETIFSGTMLVC